MTLSKKKKESKNIFFFFFFGATDLKMKVVAALVLLALVSSVGAFRNISMWFSSSKTKTPLDIYIQFTTTYTLATNEMIVIELPQFTRRPSLGNTTGLNMRYGSVKVSPSTIFMAEWIDGDIKTEDFASNMTNPDAMPHQSSELHLFVKGFAQTTNYVTGNYNEGIGLNVSFIVKLYQENKISAWCGFPSYSEYHKSVEIDRKIMMPWTFRLFTNSSTTKYDIPVKKGMGNGCKHRNDCNGHGSCNYCLEECICYAGYGARDEIFATGYYPPKDCSQSKF